MGSILLHARSVRLVFWAVLGISFVAVIVVNALPTSFLRRSVSGTLRAVLTTGQPLDENEQIDVFLDKNAPMGNIFLRFKGFNPDSSRDELFMLRIYYRSTFTLCPRRAFVCLKDKQVLTSRDFTPSDVDLSESWCKENAVETVFVFEKKNGRMLPTKVYRVE